MKSAIREAIDAALAGPKKIRRPRAECLPPCEYRHWSIWCPVDLYVSVKRVAYLRGLKVSTVTRTALRQWLERERRGEFRG
jgi:hypothetical protein